MPSDAPAPGGAPAGPDAGRDRRLHPFSWLFVLITQLRPMALPLLALVFFSRGDRWELFGMVGAAGLAIYSLVYSIGFRYRLDADEVFVREGVLGRTERHVPYARIQNIVQQQNPLHRLFGVTELRLESAGGSRPEAVMTVITTAEAARIEAVLRGHGAVTEPVAAGTPVASPIVALGPGDLVRLGLVTNRGTVVLGALFALLAQGQWYEWREFRRATRGVGGAVSGWLDALAGPVQAVLLAGVVVLVAAAVLKVLSVVMAVVTFHRFRLWRDGERLRTETGLLTRRTASARRDKLQRLHVGETWLSRRLRCQWLWCDVAAGVQAGNDDEAARLRWLVPVGTPAEVARVAEDAAPGLDLSRREWRPLHPRARRRRFTASAVAWTVVCGASAAVVGWWALPLWAATMGWAWLEARGWARFAAFAHDDDVLAWRAGWHAREWTGARVARGQVVVFTQSPFDRRHGMARVRLDTAGAGRGLRLEIPYLDAAEARDIASRLRAGIPDA
jgi:putative membrane protein